MIQHSTSTPVAEACTAVPHKRRGFTSTLLWKNFLIKRKHPIKWALEILIPVALIVLLGGLKTLSDDVAVPEGWSTDDVAHDHDKNGTSYSLFAQETSFGNVTSPRFYQTEATVSGLLLDMATTSWTTRKRASSMTTDENTACSAAAFAGNVSTDVNSPYAWPSTCRAFIIPRKLAIIPDNDFTRRYFLQTLSVWYPRVPLDASQSLVIPAITDSVAFFADEASLEAYITGGGYGKNFSTPTIAAAIVFTNEPPTLGSVGNVEYKLRLNSSLDDGGSIGDIPRTNAKAYQPLQRSIQTSEYMHYAKTGFMAYQTLVTRFALCVPDWNTQNKTTTANCTKPTSVMTSSATSDFAFVASQVQNDPNLVASIAVYMQTTKNSFNLTVVPPTSLSSLAKPLRQMPQPVGGAAVFPMPIEAYTSSPFFDGVSDSLGIIFLLSYLHILSSVLVALISEKESKARELMKILGVRDSAIIVSWYITYGIIFAVAAVLQAIVSKVLLFKHASLAILFVFFLLFGWTVMSYGYMISAIFSKSRKGTYLGMIGFFAMYLGTVAFTDTSTAESKRSVCILSPAAMTFGIKSLAKAEGNGVGITTSNWTADINNFKFTTALYALMIDCVLYTLLGLYLERVVPKDYGVTEKWFFPLSVSFWRKKFIQRRCRGVQNDMAVAVDINQDNFEPVGAELKRQEVTGEAFQIHHLRRVFPIPGGEKVAVKNVNMTMYKNQITCLLGHNGAGKTTLISMLTGMIPVSSGDATINGLSLNDDLAEIRESLGMCPQHDVLYAELTGTAATSSRPKQKIVEVGLTEKRHVYSSELSGGMKRKLSLAIALLGDSKIVFLDEPTSGMDPYSRRCSWEIILNNRMNRIVILTTHFMDEADILGDRIAIMAEGERRCCGSSLFLKNRYGAGYNFALVKAEHCNTPALIQFVQRHVGDDTKVLSNVGTEISFQLPLDGSHLFAKMFAELDDKLDGLGVVSYGISVTTLEEVFIKVAEIGDENHQHTLQKTDPSTKSAPSSSVDGSRSGFRLTDNAPLSSLKMFAVHFRALLLKRIRTARRDKRMVIFGTILPIIFVVVGVALLKGSSYNRNDPAISLTTKEYPYESNTPLPYLCESDWMCDSVNQISQAKPEPFTAVDSRVYSSSSPTVFGVEYTNVTGADSKSYSLWTGEEIFKRGYDKETSPVLGQYGGYVLLGSSQDRTFGYNLAVNTTAIHSAIVYKAMMDEALYRTIASDKDVKLTCTNAPLPLTDSNKLYLTTVVSFTTGVFVVIAFTYYTASIVPYLVNEKHPNHNSKHQQLVSGVSLPAFWLANFAFDLMLYAVPCIFGLLAIYFFNITPFTGHDCTSCPSTPFAALVVVFVLFGLAIVPFCYILSYLFVDAPSSQTYVYLINMVLGTILIVVSSVLDTIDSTKDVNTHLKFLWRLSPLFCIGNSLNALSTSTLNMALGLIEKDTSAFSTKVVGWEIAYLVIEAIVFPLVAIGIDYGLSFPKIKAIVTKDPHVVDAPFQVDEDVQAEEQRVAQGKADADAVVMKNLRKVYKGGKVGLVDLSLALPKGECFGYLGINGAGKTTTMKIMTGDGLPTSGAATLGGFDIMTQQLDVRRLIGYCPQFDALIDLLTVREHLELFAAIKGVPIDLIGATVMEKMDQMNLNDFENKLAGKLSGGNKRKLSVAIALIGSPSIIFLDEPSTGMDPVSRRFMWDVIADISTRSKESTILLTTHSMEECEALCTRVGIMVGGRLRCLGSIQHLKNRFGDGLMMHVRVAPVSSNDVDRFSNEAFGLDTMLTKERMDEAYAALGKSHRARCVTSSHATGYVLAESLTRNGYIRVHDFSAWWLSEGRFEALSEYLGQGFGSANVQLLERQSDVSRFKLLGTKQTLALSNVFSMIETSKADLSVKEYTVSQTTFEQIFNNFASQQTQETGVARGVETQRKKNAHDNYQAMSP
ncbi:hypothetical protein LEN26_018836 [Aphanomyces euteiches]|nr:hypothetical protein LEN26_018836 [Aphanomyces euteiches]KAH9104969.1 hypothetical protein AeMF1_019092 [Aphanomyces euteiches]KAH9194176.1 hypothetical protein AeNC1_003853 [Aphanomyces euteiches]